MGIAVSDEEKKIAFPKETYRRSSDKDDLQYFKKIIEEEDIEKIVIGVPINMDGSKGFQAENALEFKKMLDKELGVNITAVDERLTSSEAERVLIKGEENREDRKEKRDKLAASLILQRYLNSIKSK